jgi:hypothetical protein
MGVLSKLRERYAGTEVEDDVQKMELDLELAQQRVETRKRQEKEREDRIQKAEADRIQREAQQALHSRQDIAASGIPLPEDLRRKIIDSTPEQMRQQAQDLFAKNAAYCMAQREIDREASEASGRAMQAHW